MNNSVAFIQASVTPIMKLLSLIAVAWVNDAKKTIQALKERQNELVNGTAPAASSWLSLENICAN